MQLCPTQTCIDAIRCFSAEICVLKCASDEINGLKLIRQSGHVGTHGRGEAGGVSSQCDVMHFSPRGSGQPKDQEAVGAE